MSLETELKFNIMRERYEKEMNSEKSAWLNAEATKPKEFKWPNKNLVPNTFYGGKNPDNSGQDQTVLNEGCLAFSKLDEFKLNDAPCSNSFDVICEYHN